VQETVQLWPEIIEQCIKERRSIRVYKDDDVEDYKLMKVLEAGNWAPSAGNLHSRHFIVIQSQEGKKKLIECVRSSRISKTGKGNLMKAPVFIIICADPKNCKIRYAGRKSLMFSIQDAAAATQNMAIMAHALGLGTCWVGNFDESSIISGFSLRKGLYPVAILALGYPAYSPPPPRKKSIEEVTEFHLEAEPGKSVYKP
jgi:nitroreductase